jgi:hypothetical protein
MKTSINKMTNSPSQKSVSYNGAKTSIISKKLESTNIKKLPTSFWQNALHIDLRKETNADKKKALLLYKTLRKTVLPVTALSLVAVFQYA